MIITLIGPDGSGKTSVRQRVASLLHDRYPGLAVHEYERRFRLLPTIGTLLGRKSAPSDLKRVVEHKVDHKHPIRSLITVLYYTLEYLAYKIVLSVSPRTERKTIRLFSRYWHDYYFGFEHTRLPLWLLRVLEWFVPQPDLIIFLDRPPETIRNDKPELPIAEIRRQQGAIANSVFAKRPQFRRVRATSDLQSTAELVFNHIRACIEGRCGALISNKRTSGKPCTSDLRRTATASKRDLMLAPIPGKTLVLGNSTHPRAFLAVVRSLGRLGLDVSVLVNEGDHGSGLSSRYVQNVYRLDSSNMERTDWVASLLQIVANERFEAVIPTNDAVVIPLQERRDLLIGLEDRFYLVNDKAYRVAHNKQQSRHLAERLGIPVAGGTLCASVEEVRAMADRYGYPLILKPLHSFTIDNITSRQMVRTLRSACEIERAFDAISPPAVVEQFFRGHGCGVEFLANGGRMLYSFQHERVHEPLQGGGSSYRKSMELNPHLVQATRSIIEDLDYTGVGMVEFKLDKETGRYIFIEINARFWGSLPLAVAAGADFPAMLYRMLWRGETEFSRAYRRDLYSRNETRDAVWFVQNLRADKSDATLMTRPILSVLAESRNVVMGRERWDMLDLRDPRPALSELTQLAGLAWQKLLGSMRPS